MCSLSMLQCCLYCECNVSANRTQSDENWLSKAMLRCSLTSRMQRYNMHNPKSKFFRCLISHLESFSDLRMCIQSFIYGHFGAFFILEKKMKSGYNILSLADSQNVRSSHVLPPQNVTAPTHFFATEPRVHLKIPCTRFL